MQKEGRESLLSQSSVNDEDEKMNWSLFAYLIVLLVGSVRSDAEADPKADAVADAEPLAEPLADADAEAESDPDGRRVIYVQAPYADQLLRYPPVSDRRAYHHGHGHGHHKSHHVLHTGGSPDPVAVYAHHEPASVEVVAAQPQFELVPIISEGQSGLPVHLGDKQFEVVPYHPQSHVPHPVLPPHAPLHYPPHNSLGRSPTYDAGPPKCAKKTKNNYCVDDYDYPKYEIEEALLVHYELIVNLYKDVYIMTENSVEDLEDLEEETYVCPSETEYIQPLRAENSKGKWKIIVNRVKLNYDTLTQSARVEECTTPGSECPIVPRPYGAECVQKAVYHRFLTFDPYDPVFPFSLDSFKLPASCACYAPEYTISAAAAAAADKKKKRKRKKK